MFKNDVSTTTPFLIFENKFFNDWNHQKTIFIKKVLNFIIIDSFKKIGNDQVTENLFSKKMIRDL